MCPGLREHLRAVEAEIGRIAQAHMPLLRGASRHVSFGGAKRLRPVILLLSAEACGKVDDRAILHAAVVELLHVASLAHDDVIDESGFRRGKPSARSRWGNKISVLVGDYLLARSFWWAAMDESPLLMQELTKAAAQMCVGQIRELTAVPPELTERGCLETAAAKTASLFCAAARIGARLGGGSPQQVDALGRFGSSFGTAYQVADDVVDFIAPEEAVGKPVGRDLTQGKVTLPLVYVLRRGPAQARKKALAALGDGAPSLRDVRMLRELAVRHGGIDYARQAVLKHLARAKKALAPLAETPAKRALTEACGPAFPLPIFDQVAIRWKERSGSS